MGDYTKLIVNCGLKKMTDKETESFKILVQEKLGGLCSSAYHCGGELLELDNEWHHRTDLTIVNQHKYSIGIIDFIDWLRPYVVDGMGQDEVFAMAFTEYDDIPNLFTMGGV